jgi:DNA-binding MarR family transcriptional regulator
VITPDPAREVAVVDRSMPPPRAPLAQIDDAVHERHRLWMLKVLAGSAEPVNFTDLQEALGMTPGNTNRHLKLLVQGGFVQDVQAHGTGRRRRMLQITEEGGQAFRRELDLLAAIEPWSQLAAQWLSTDSRDQKPGAPAPRPSTTTDGQPAQPRNRARLPPGNRSNR